VFNALQTYSSGEKVNWNEVSADPSIEPEHPAPILTITPAVAEEMSGQADGSGQASQDEITSTAQSDTASDWTLPLVVSAVALLLSLISTAVAWRRGWRPNSQLEAESATTREDVNV
jgi:periplasmic copper chaperone A